MDPDYIPGDMESVSVGDQNAPAKTGCSASVSRHICGVSDSVNAFFTKIFRCPFSSRFSALYPMVNRCMP